MPPTKTTAAKDGTALAEQFFGQVSESIQLVFDLTSRIDERVKMLIERQKEIDDQIEKLLEMQQSVIHRLTHLEAKDFASVEKDLEILSEKLINDSLSDKKLVHDTADALRTKVDATADTLRTKVDEVAKTLQAKVEAIEVKVEVLNVRMGHHDTRIGSHDNRWSKIFDYAWKLGLMLIAGYILYKLGIEPPP